jgi:hypothetical protein
LNTVLALFVTVPENFCSQLMSRSVVGIKTKPIKSVTTVVVKKCMAETLAKFV